MWYVHVSNNIGAVVVFDGFSTKHEAHNCSMGNYVGASVSVSAELCLTMSLKHFCQIRLINRP